MLGNNNNFQTTDINLAAWLHFNNVPLISVEAIDLRKSNFVFEQPPQVLLDKWLAGNTPAGIIDAYRHLLRQAKVEQDKLVGGRR